ncbi:hypothetical protein E4T44_09359 [Aureobasidium sp. EXF-8845]|nr:hypothetical protein E4T44_09359 [Aureobasidium sp. EXF-8845]
MSTTTTTTTATKATLNTLTTKSQDIEVPRGPVTSTLIFYAPPPDNSAPWNYVEQPPPGFPQRNYTEHPSTVEISDIRNQESSFSLNTHGFTTASNIPSQCKDFTSEEQIKTVYYPEVEKLILDQVPGAKRVFLFDHTIRRADPDSPRQPVHRAHVDQTEKSARQRVHHHLPSEASTLLESRVRIINIWRPLNGPVVSFPLAVADSRSVTDEAVVGVEHRYPDRVGETAGILHQEGQKWWYWSGMGNEERLFLQCYDSHGGKARTPHTAFKDPRTQEGWPGRESIEVRALVFG